MRSKLSHVLAILVLASCGSQEKPPADTAVKTAAPHTATPAPSATTEVSARASTSASAPASASPKVPRDVATRNILGAFQRRDPEDIGAMAAVGISEEGYGLPAEQLKALAAAGSHTTPRKDCPALLASALEASAKSLVEKRCGDFGALKALLEKTPAAGREDAMIKACKLPATGDKERHDPWALLTSAVVADELALQPESNEDEKLVALGLGYACFPK
jgi:hypothetical protein